MVANLEKQNEDLKKILREYKEEGKENWETFKLKFNRNMNDLDNSINNFFTKEK
jgi:hypothetical protein